MVDHDIQDFARAARVSAWNGLARGDIDLVERGAQCCQPFIGAKLLVGIQAHERLVVLVVAHAHQVIKKQRRAVVVAERLLQRRAGKGKRAAAEHRRTACLGLAVEQRDRRAEPGGLKRRTIACQSSPHDDNVIGVANVACQAVASACRIDQVHVLLPARSCSDADDSTATSCVRMTHVNWSRTHATQDAVSMCV